MAKGNSTVVILFIFILLLIAGVVMLLSGNIKPGKLNTEMKKQLDDVTNSTANAINSAGGDLSAEEYKNTIKETAKKSCFVSKNAEGVCPMHYVEEKLEDGEVSDCCIIPDPIEPSKREKNIELARELTKALVIGIMIDIGVDLVLQLVVTAGVSIAAKFGASFTVAGTMGPVGWAILVLDLATMLLDFFDPFGFNAFISGEVHANSKKVIAAQFQQAIENQGMKYPLILIGQMLHPQIAEIATMHAFSDVQVYLTKLEGGYLTSEEYKQKVLEAEEKNGNGLEFAMEAASNYTLEWIEEGEGKKYFDKAMYERFKEHLENINPIYVYDIQYNESAIDDGYNTGIWATKVGTERWNNLRKMKWEDPDEESGEFVAVWDNKYYEVNKDDPGTSQEPNVFKVKTKNNKKIPMLFSYEGLIKQCVSPLEVRSLLGDIKTAPDIDPRKYGVYYNYNTNQCDWEQRWCTRFAGTLITNTDDLGNRYVDCSFPPSNEYVPIFGSTAFMRGMAALGQAIVNLFDPPRDPDVCKIPLQSVPGHTEENPSFICTKDSQCTSRFDRDMYCVKEIGNERGECVPVELADEVGSYCNTNEALNENCTPGLYCDEKPKEKAGVPGAGSCKYLSSSGSDPEGVPFAICEGSRELFRYDLLNTTLKEAPTSETHWVPIKDTKCMKMSRFGELGTQSECPSGHVLIKTERSNCASWGWIGGPEIGRGYCAPLSLKDKENGYRYFKEDEVEVWRE